MKTALLTLFIPSMALAQGSWNLNAPLDQIELVHHRFPAKSTNRPRLAHREKLKEINRRLAGSGWTAGSYRLGDWEIYALEHKEGAVWRSQFFHKLMRQVERVERPELLPIESHDPDALLLIKRAAINGQGWRIFYHVALSGPNSSPETTWELISPTLNRRTSYESEYVYWLHNGPMSCWGADRPFPNCPGS
ncbi:MAG: hypothetical protein HY549_03275 [Elusimicrobia bacterium]|nr:hypothetical protein [Elusimicrobiota bacterium]